MASDSGVHLQASLQSAAKSVQYQVFLQFASRLLTFVLNGFIIHYVSKELLGIVNIRLMLLYTTIQFLSREGFRRACTEKFGRTPREWKPVINLLWLNTPLCVAFGVGLSLLWYYAFERPPNDAEHKFLGHFYKQSVIAYAAAACIESLAEPFFVTAQAYHYVRTRVVIQGVAISIQTLINALGCVGIVRGFNFASIDREHAVGDGRNQYMLLVFAFSQLCYSASIVVMYVLFFSHQLRCKRQSSKFAVTKDAGQTSLNEALPMQTIADFLPSISFKHAGDSRLSQKHARLAYSFVKQGLLKQLLTEGERYIMTITSVIDFRQQGVYDIVNNLGALCVRTVFAPLEENAYVFFSRAFPRTYSSAVNQTRASLDSEQVEHVLKISSNLSCNEPDSLLYDDAAEVLKSLQGGKGDAVDDENVDDLAEVRHRKLLHASKKSNSSPVSAVVMSADEKQRSLATLHHLLRFVVLLGLIAFTYGFNYCDILLRLYGGTELVLHGTRMMQTYCFYLMFLAVNGILEAFAFAVMTDTQVQESYKAFAKVSVAYVGAVFVLTWTIRRDATGFILANCINMLIRIVYSYGVANKYLQRFTKGMDSSRETGASMVILHALIPHTMVIKSLVLAGLFCYSSKMFIYQASGVMAKSDSGVVAALGPPLISFATFGHMLIGGSFGLITLWCVWKFERDTVVFIRNVVRGRQTSDALAESVAARKAK